MKTFQVLQTKPWDNASKPVVVGRSHADSKYDALLDYGTEAKLDHFQILWTVEAPSTPWARDFDGYHYYARRVI